MTNYSLITLGELLSSENETIKRNAVSILKQLQKNKCKHENLQMYGDGRIEDWCPDCQKEIC
jgi:hypothetical protein